MRIARPAALAVFSTAVAALLFTVMLPFTEAVGNNTRRCGLLSAANEAGVVQKGPGPRGFLPKNAAPASSTPVSAPQWAERMFKDGLGKDFGVVPRGTQLSHRFEITNIYADPVQIAVRRLGCGCVTAALGKTALEPGESTTIDVTLDTRGFTGPRKQSVRVTVGPRVTFGANPASSCLLNVSVISQTDVLVKPDVIAFGAVERGQASTRTVDVEYNGTRDWKIEEVVVAKALPLQATLSEPVRQSGKVGYRLKVTLQGDAPAGVIKDYLYLKTNEQNAPPVPVRVAATVQPPLIVLPGVLPLGTVSADEPLTRRVLLRGTRPFRVTAVEGLGDDITLGVELPKASATMQTVTFRCVFRTSGEFKRQLKITTDLPEPPVTVTIQGTVGTRSSAPISG